jgi:hypothetical protein
MTRDPIVRRRKIKVAVAVLTVGIVISALVATALIYMAGKHLGS